MEYPYYEFLQQFKETDLNWQNRDENNKAVVMVEGNCRWQVPLVLSNFKHFLGNDWNLHLFVTGYNLPWITELTHGSKINLYRLAVPRVDSNVFNKFYLGLDFWSIFKEEYVLTIQADTICCKPLDEKWFSYDMVGAPCGVDTLNGGLSLRKVAAMREVLRQYGAFVDGNTVEDIFFTKCLRLMGGNLPDGYDAARFSVESNYYELPFGVHGTDKGYHSTHVAQRIVNQIEL